MKPLIQKKLHDLIILLHLLEIILNTPLIQLSVNDSNINIWDEIILTSTVKDILERNLTKKSKIFLGFWWWLILW